MGKEKGKEKTSSADKDEHKNKARGKEPETPVKSKAKLQEKHAKSVGCDFLYAKEEKMVNMVSKQVSSNEDKVDLKLSTTATAKKEKEKKASRDTAADEGLSRRRDMKGEKKS